MESRFKLLLGTFWVFLFCTVFHTGKAAELEQREFMYSTLPADQALVQNSVRAIAQDHHGFLWVGTLGGLHRYDGNQMILINDLDLAGSSLDFVQIESLSVDLSGDLWIGGVYGGLNRLRMSDSSIESFSELTTPLRTNEESSIYGIFPDSKGLVWLTVGSEILRLDPHRRTAQKLDPDFPSSWEDETLNHIALLGDGFFVVSNFASVGLYDEAENRISEIPFKDGSYLKKPYIMGAFELTDGSHWIFGKSSLLAEIKGEGRNCYLEPHPLPEGFDFMNLTQGKMGDLWLTTAEDQICVYNPKTKDFFIQKPKFDGRVFVESDWLKKLFYDRTGIMWLGTESYGLAFNDPSSTRFHKLSGRSSATNHFNNPYLWDIKEVEGGLYIAGRYELGFMDSQTHTYHRLLNTLDHPVLRQKEDLFCILPLDENRILLGHQYNSPGIFDLRDSSFTKTNTDSLGHMRAFVEGRNNRIWALGVLGCLLLDRESLLPVELPSPLKEAVQGIELRELIEDDDGVLWIGTQNKGLIRYNPASKHLSTWNMGDGPRDLPHSGVRSLYLDDQNNLWVGTYGGLVQLPIQKTETRKGDLRVYTTADGLPNNTIYDILPGPDGTLWLTTNLGLSNFDPATGIFQNYDQDDGLANNEFNGGASFLDKDGCVYFGGIDGLTWFKSGEVYRNDEIPPVAITRLVVGDNTEYSTFELPLLKEINLPWNRNTIEVNLAALCFQQPTKQEVAYRIPEIDPTWWTAPRDQAIRVTNLPSGNLHFEFKASNNDMAWSETKVLLLRVGTPPWLTTPAILGYLAAILLTIWILRHRHQRRQAQKEETIQQLALADKLSAVGRLAAGMAHDFNNQLQIIMGNAELLKIHSEQNENNQGPLDIIISTGRRAGFLASRLLAYAKDTDPARTTLNLDEIVIDLRDLMTSFLGARITLTIKPGPGEKLIQANREQIEQVLMNLCLNSRDAILTTGSIEITTDLTQTESGKQMCVCEVRDSGKGISDSDMKHIFEPFFTTKGADKGSGLGLSMVERIVKRHGGHMVVSENDLGGATFQAVLPLCDQGVVTQVAAAVASSSPISHGTTVLVADDEPAVNKLTSQILTQAGFNVISVQDGLKGIEALDEHPEIQLAILDVVMPVLDGRAVYEHILKTGRDIPVLFCSGFSFSVLNENEFKDLDVPVLAKPFTAVELLAAVSELQTPD